MHALNHDRQRHIITATQEKFNGADGDSWYARNKAALETAVERDWALRLIERNRLKPVSVLEIGCANGWRLAEIQRRYGNDCWGFDLSTAAIAEGHRCWPELGLWVADVAQPWTDVMVPGSPTPLSMVFDMVIVSFVLHWVPREGLLQALANIDRVLDSSRHLVLQDFDPIDPVDVSYHHRPGVMTYKRDYSTPFLAAGYQVVDSRFYDYNTGEGLADNPDAERAVCWLLRKGAA